MARPRIPQVVKSNVFQVIYASVILTAAYQNLLMPSRGAFYTRKDLTDALDALRSNEASPLNDVTFRDIVRRLRKIPKGVKLIPDAPMGDAFPVEAQVTA